MALERKSLTIQMHEDMYVKAVNSFEAYGASMSASFNRSPRLAYEIFDICIRQLCKNHEVTLENTPILTGYDLQANEQLRELERQTDMGGMLPRLEDDAQEIVIQIMKRPTFGQWFRKKVKDPKIETVFKFSVPQEEK